MACWLRFVFAFCFLTTLASGAKRIPIRSGKIIDCRDLVVKQKICYGDKVFRPEERSSAVEKVKRTEDKKFRQKKIHWAKTLKHFQNTQADR